jgi:hypothetical protein
VGSENVSFPTPKVLAEGQTSRSGGWVKKISPDNDEGQWVVDGCQQSKKNEGFALLLKRRQIKFGSFAMAFPPCSRILLSRKIVWLESMRIFGPFLL